MFRNRTIEELESIIAAGVRLRFLWDGHVRVLYNRGAVEGASHVPHTEIARYMPQEKQGKSVGDGGKSGKVLLNLRKKEGDLHFRQTRRVELLHNIDGKACGGRYITRVFALRARHTIPRYLHRSLRTSRIREDAD